MAQQAQDIGVDLGFGTVCIAGPSWRDSFTSAIAMAGAGSDSAGLVDFGKGYGVIVGEPALDDQAHTYTASRRKFHLPEEKARYCAALARAAEHYDTNRFIVTTGLPPADFQIPALRTDLAASLKGTFEFTYGGRQFKIQVDDVRVDPQAGAAFYDFLLNDAGDVMTPELADSDHHTLIIDPGHLTTDLYMARGRQAMHGPESLKTIPMGVWAAYEELQRLIFKHFRLPLSAEQMDRIWRSGYVRVDGKREPVGELQEQAARKVATVLRERIERTAQDLRMWDTIALTGGGAIVFGPFLQLPGRTLTTDGEEAFGNAAGYFKRWRELSKANGGK